MQGWVKIEVLVKARKVESNSWSEAQVLIYARMGKKKVVAEYCLQDTFVTYGCNSRMVFQKLHSREDVCRMPQYIHVD